MKSSKEITFTALFMIIVYIGISQNTTDLPIDSFDNRSATYLARYEPTKISFIEIYVNGLAPQGLFQRNIGDKLIVGGGISFLHQVRAENPLFWGFEYQWSPYDAQRASFDEIVDFTISTFDYRTYANIQAFYGKVRFYPSIQLWGIEPYFEALVGAKWLFSATTKTLADVDDATADFMTEESRLSLSYGAGFGLNKLLSEDIYLNLRGSFIPGLPVRYLVNEKLPVMNSSIDAFARRRSATNLVNIAIGVTFTID